VEAVAEVDATWRASWRSSRPSPPPPG